MPKQQPYIPDDLTTEEKLKLLAWVEREYPQYAQRSRLRKLVDICLDWHRANGKTRKDWLATCRNWIRKQADIDAANPAQAYTIPETERLMREATARKQREIEAYQARRRQEELEELARDQAMSLNVINLESYRK